MIEPSDHELGDILGRSPTIAVLGIHDDPTRPAHYVPAYLFQHGYRIIGVNPVLAGRALFGVLVRASLAEVDEAIDLVDVFRRPDALPAHVGELRASRAPVVWLQQGIRHDEVAALLTAGGQRVIADRCTLAEHRRLRLGAPIRRSPKPLT
jgi:uncharacterized protein